MADITSEQLQQLQTLVATLVADKAAEDTATATASASATAAAQAAAQAAQDNLAEANAQQTVATDLQALQSFVDGLVVPPTP